MKPEAFQACFANWLTSFRAHAAEASEVEQPVFAVDGKTLRRSHDRNKGLGALHSVSVWATDYGLTLGQVATEEKSNEITAIPELLRLVDIQGAIITIDAMGTQKAIAKQIVEAKADYLLALKGNQDTIHQGVISYVDEQLNDQFPKGGGGASYHDGERPWAGGNSNLYPNARSEKFAGFWSLERFADDWPRDQLLPSRWKRNERDALLSQQFADRVSNQFAHAVRSHWGIENTCHWSLDMTYREDESRIRDANLRENFAWLNRFTLSLLKQHPSKESLAMKRNHCAWSESILNGSPYWESYLVRAGPAFQDRSLRGGSDGPAVDLVRRQDLSALWPNGLDPHRADPMPRVSGTSSSADFYFGYFLNNARLICFHSP